MNPWKQLAARYGVPEDDLQELGNISNADIKAVSGEAYPTKEPQAAPPQGKSRRFDGHWIQTPQGLKFIQTKVWYE